MGLRRRVLDALCPAVLVRDAGHQPAYLRLALLLGDAVADQVFPLPAFILCHASSISSSLVSVLGGEAAFASALILFTSAALSLIMYSIRSNCSCVTHHLGNGLYPAARSARAAGLFSSDPLLTAQASRSASPTRSRHPWGMPRPRAERKARSAAGCHAFSFSFAAFRRSCWSLLANTIP